MSDLPPPTPEEARAANRYTIMQMTRFLTLGLIITGIAIANERLPAPYWLGVVIAVTGLLGFFFGPWLLAKRWKAGDRAE